MAHGRSCSAACGIFPDQGSNPCPLRWQADSQPLRHQGSPTSRFLRRYNQHARIQHLRKSHQSIQAVICSFVHPDVFIKGLLMNLRLETQQLMKTDKVSRNACKTVITSKDLGEAREEDGEWGDGRSSSSILNRVSKNDILRASLVAQWLRVCLPVQGTRVRALVWEDPTCRGAAGPVSHNC